MGGLVPRGHWLGVVSVGGKRRSPQSSERAQRTAEGHAVIDGADLKAAGALSLLLRED